MTAKMWQVLAVFKGDLLDACRVAEYKHPSQAAAKLAKNPIFMGYLKAAEKTFVHEMAKTAGQEAGKWNGLERGERRHILAKIARDDNKPPAARVAAIRADAELAGDLIKKFADVSKELDGRTVEELEYFNEHGYFREDKPMEPGQPSSDHTASGSPAQDQ